METLKDFITYQKIVKNLSINTLKSYETDIMEFIKYIGDTNFETMTKQDVCDYLEFVENKGNSATTRNRKLSSVKNFFTWMHNQQLIQINVTSSLEFAKVIKKKPQAFTKQEASKILKYAEKNLSKRDYLIFQIFLNCGLRRFELCNIQMDNVEIEKNSILILGKGGKERYVYFNDYVKTLLKDYIKTEREETNKFNSNFLFVSRKNDKISERRMSELIDNVLMKLKLKREGMSVHALRKTYATLLHRNGVDINIIKEVLGHASIETTTIYVSIDNDQVKNAAMKLKI